PMDILNMNRISIAHKNTCIRLRIVVIKAIIDTQFIMLKLGANLYKLGCGSNEHRK
ncbi:uncharacterized protein METZ01_LOCUS133591, partial [marine metagenome]